MGPESDYQAGQARRTVLVVDDSPTMRGMIRKALLAGGYQVDEAFDGLEGLAHLETHWADAVLTDINMPRMDGLAFIRSVRRDGRFMGLPILALTTECQPEMKAAGKAAGATGWIVKPFDPGQLCQIIDQVLKRAAERAGGPRSQNAGA